MPSNGDPSAYHWSHPDEFGRAPRKASPVATDRIAIEDSEDGFKPGYAEIGDLPFSSAIQIEDDGTPVADAEVINFGTGLSVTDNGSGEVTVDAGNLSYAGTVGDGSETTFPIEHGLGTEDLVVQLWDLTGAVPVEATADADTIEVTDADTVTVTFAAPPAVDSYRVVVLSDGGTSSGGGGFAVEWDAEVETGPAQDHATTSSYNRIEGTLVPLVPFFWIESVTVYSNAATTYELVINGVVVWTGALGVTGPSGSLQALDSPVLLGAFPYPNGVSVIWRSAADTNQSLYGRDANYADSYFSMAANNPFRTVSGSGNSSASYCPAFKIHGYPGSIDWESLVTPPV